MTHVEIGAAAAAEDVVAVLNNQPFIVAGDFINGMRPGVRSIELQALAHAFIGGDPKSVVIRIGTAVTEGNGIPQRSTGENRAVQRQLLERPAGGTPGRRAIRESGQSAADQDDEKFHLGGPWSAMEQHL